MKSTTSLMALAAALLAGTACVRAADVTFERLRNPEPHNWLMNHHDYNSQHFSALDAINTSNVKNLKLAFAVALGGTSGNENLVATPLVDDGFMYMADAWGVVYKIDLHAGTMGRILWKMDPGQEKMDRNRGVALWGNLVVSVTSHEGRVIATDKEGRQDRLGQEPARPARHDAQRGAARACRPDHRRRLGRRPGRAQLAGGARPEDGRRPVEDVRRARAR